MFVSVPPFRPRLKIILGKIATKFGAGASVKAFDYGRGWENFLKIEFIESITKAQTILCKAGDVVR